MEGHDLTGMREGENLLQARASLGGIFEPVRTNLEIGASGLIVWPAGSSRCLKVRVSAKRWETGLRLGGQSIRTTRHLGP